MIDASGRKRVSAARPAFPDSFGSRPEVGLVARDLAASCFEPLRDRGAEWRRRLELLEQARRFVYVSTYYLEWDRYGRAFLEALTAARRRGAHVVLVADAFGQRLGGVAMEPDSRRALMRALDQLRRLGAGQLLRSPPADPALARRRPARQDPALGRRPRALRLEQRHRFVL